MDRVVAVSERGRAFVTDARGAIASQWLLRPHRSDFVGEAVVYPQLGRLVLHISGQPRMHVWHYEAPGGRAQEIAVQGWPHGVFDLLKPHRGTEVVALLLREGDDGRLVDEFRAYDVVTRKRAPVRDELFARLSKGRSDNLPTYLFSKPVRFLNRRLVLWEPGREHPKPFAGPQPPPEVAAWLSKPLVCDPGMSLPFFVGGTPHGAVFVMSAPETAVGRRYANATLFWHTADRSWRLVTHTHWSDFELARGSWSVFRESLSISGSRVLSGLISPAIPTGRWQLYHFPTKRMSTIALSQRAAILDARDSRILAAEDDTVYVARAREGRIDQPATQAAWTKYWKPVLKHPFVREVRWAFLLDPKPTK